MLGRCNPSRCQARHFPKPVSSLVPTLIVELATTESGSHLLSIFFIITTSYRLTLFCCSENQHGWIVPHLQHWRRSHHSAIRHSNLALKLGILAGNCVSTQEFS
jgi:hypothetical protein